MINNINTVLATEFDVIGGDVQPTSPGDPTFVYKQWTTSPIFNIDLSPGQIEYDRANIREFMEPYNTNVIGDREIVSLDEFHTIKTDPSPVDLYQDYRKLLLTHRTVIEIDNIFNYNSNVFGYQPMDDRKIFDFFDFYDGKFESNPAYLGMDHTRLALVNRTQIDLSTLGVIGEVVNGPYTVEDPPPIEGDLYKVFGTVQQLGAVPSRPTNVMIVNRSGGSLSTITVSPDPQGRFVKYYKDLPPGTTFMVIGLWDPEETPYYEPVIVDRIVATKL